MTSIRLSPSLVLLALACSAEPAARTDTAVAAIDSSVIASPPADVPPVAGQENPPANPSQTPTAPPLTVTEFGIGALRAGMTVPEGARMVGGSFAAPGAGAENCTYAIWREAPSGVRVMLEKGLVARVDVTSGSVATSKGARIGDTEARVKDLYKGRIAETPHKYTPGAHYLTVSPAPGSGDDTAYRLVFETDGNRVTRYRGGKQPAVEYVEGCS